MLPEVTPTGDRARSPISLDFPPPPRQRSFVLTRNAQGRGGKGTGKGAKGRYGATLQMTQTEDMQRPTQPDCPRCGVNGAGMTYDRYGNPIAWEPLCEVCGAVPLLGCPISQMKPRVCWDPTRGTE